MLCRAVDDELSRAQRTCEAVGPGTISGRLWAAAVALSDAITECQAAERDMLNVARSVGITDERWAEIRGRRLMIPCSPSLNAAQQSWPGQPEL